MFYFLRIPFELTELLFPILSTVSAAHNDEISSAKSISHLLNNNNVIIANNVSPAPILSIILFAKAGKNGFY